MVRVGEKADRAAETVKLSGFSDVASVDKAFGLDITESMD